MSGADWQEAFLLVAAEPIIQLTVLGIAFSIMWACAMPLVTIVQILRRRWRP